MDDGLVLNLADDDVPSSSKSKNQLKGGRWTDRLKAKRVAKRKTRPSETVLVQGNTLYSQKSKPSLDVDEHQRKRPRFDRAAEDSIEKQPAQSRPHTQIISSLFSRNPQVAAPKNAPYKGPSTPSNAPLSDASDFDGLGLNPLLSAHLSKKMEIKKPTAIQRAALPAILSTVPEDVERDVFIQSQTGSGKTLSFLLPIIQDLLPLSSLSYIDRSIGTLAIIIAPTRELAKQISDVLEDLLKLRLRAEHESADDLNTARLTRWLVSGLLIGGSTRAHEKARLRKGLPILVCTPGRLLDHLQKTASFNVAKCRWLVLDEADRLMELGFEDTITGILKGLDGHRKLALQALNEGIGREVGGWDWERKRRTILCSATIREDVQKLAGATLVRPIIVKATQVDLPPQSTSTKSRSDPILAPSDGEKFTPPSQLSQKYIVTPLKLRLVVLIALLRNIVSHCQSRPGSKAIVFVSCTDAVDFLWTMLGGCSMGGEEVAEAETSDEESSDGAGDKNPSGKSKPSNVVVKSPLLPDTSVFRLHGSLTTSVRMESLRGFSGKSKHSSPFSVLLCTSVASRGLDLPLVRAVVQYDLPTEGGTTEYVHRVGRTARAGNGGEAWSIVAPSEIEWVKWVEGRMNGENQKSADNAIGLSGVTPESVLKLGFGGAGIEYEERATQVQLAFERWVLKRKENAELARKAFLSHMRAYATHPSDEKHIFHIRHLHIGHLAKAFALRDAPKAVTGGARKSQGKGKAKGTSVTGMKAKQWDQDDRRDVGKRMHDVVRSQGRHLKKGGVMASTDTSEFQIAGGYDLEQLVGKI
ncbi:DEAD-domain-containing protein [Dendrothele bispora CBS 962.96]|uniref:ATP-dependent RNA helicase n=1 Tax=Dendrothele bispora (strain CBS 962.96) TaxID=1314807 RepID=A0A4V4HHE7_DENBC|nr:DEAD-domain-containing protein [Dendrothele bispora CBS 962.96]